MGSNPRNVAALVIVLIVVIGLFSVYASMCCQIWGIKHRVLKLLRWCLNCVTNSSEGDTNQTPRQRIIQSLTPWTRRTQTDSNQTLENPSSFSANELADSIRTPPPTYSTLKSPNPPTYSTATNRAAPKEIVGNGSCSNWAIVVNEKEQTAKASVNIGKINLSYEETEGNSDTRENSAKDTSNDGSKYLEISIPNEQSDINENKIESSPSLTPKNIRKRKQSIFGKETSCNTQVGNSNFFDRCESIKIISTWSTPFSQCQPFQSEMENVYAGNSICHFVNTKFIVDGMKRDSVTRSFIVSPVKMDKNDGARLTSYRNIDNDKDSSYEHNNNTSQLSCSTEEMYCTSSALSESKVPTLLVTDPEDNLIYQSGGINGDDNFLASVPVAS